VLGSLRRERLDWLIVLGEHHLTGILCEYFDLWGTNIPSRAYKWLA